MPYVPHTKPFGSQPDYTTISASEPSFSWRYFQAGVRHQPGCVIGLMCCDAVIAIKSDRTLHNSEYLITVRDQFVRELIRPPSHSEAQLCRKGV